MSTASLQTMLLASSSLGSYLWGSRATSIRVAELEFQNSVHLAIQGFKGQAGSSA